MDAYYQNAILFTGLTGLLAMIPCLWLTCNFAKTMAVENSENVTVAWNGSGIFSVCQYACGNTAVGFELSGISGIYGPADGRKTNVVPDLIYGNHSTACRGNRFSLADLSETSGLYANGSSCCNFWPDFWNLSWKSGTGCLCEPSWNSVCIYSGYQWMSVEQCAIAYGG